MPAPFFRQIRGVFRKAALPLAVKWTMVIGALIALVMSVLGWLLITLQDRVHTAEIEIFGGTIVQQFAHSASEPLLAEDQLALEGLVNRQLKNRNLVGSVVSGIKQLHIAAGTNPEKLPDPSKPYYWTDRSKPNIKRPLVTFSNPILFNKIKAGEAYITLDRAFLDSYRQTIINVIAGATLLLIVIASFLTYGLSRQLARPISRLAEAGQSESSEEPAYSTYTDRRDEIGQVYSHFQRMSTGLLQKQQVEEALARYVSPKVAEKILANLSDTRLANSQIKGSVLFCDIVGFTRMSEHLPPDQVAELLNLYLGNIAEAAQHSHGMVDKFIGDAAMILFGAPDPDPHHATHAVRCACLIVALIDRINRNRHLNHEQPIQVRIGINSGDMLAGNIGIPERLEYTVIGDTVNVASRLCDRAPTSGILISEATASPHAVRNTVDLTLQAPINVKGRKEPVSTLLVNAPKDKFARRLAATVKKIRNSQETA